ncbi:MAG TPA: rhodanese-like domain-containing protein [Candidatus Azosocius sp. HAIN]
MYHFFDFLFNHWILLFSFFLFLFLLILNELSHLYFKNSISSSQLVSLMNLKNVVIIDCREKALYLKGHILGSNNIIIDDNEFFFKKFLKKTIVLICDNGKYSSKKVSFLKKRGCFDVKFLEGGIVSWINNNLPLV